jgi:hypothetical protein
MDWDLISDVPVIETVTLEPHWPGVADYVLAMARSDLKTARSIAATIPAEHRPSDSDLLDQWERFH